MSQYLPISAQGAGSAIRNPQIRYIVAGVILFLTLFSLVSFSGYTSAGTWIGTGSDGMPQKWKGGAKDKGDSVFVPTVEESEWAANDGVNRTRENAAFVILARNSDVWEITASIRGMEDRFNKNYHYPYVFLNDEPFSDEFKKHTSGIASGLCTYGQIPKNQWSEQPDWIDQDKAAKLRKEMEEANVIYGGSLSYRMMCRYQSGFFWRHPLLDTYEYYWRIEPSVKYFCDIDYDPFKVMVSGGKKYGFTVTIYEYIETIKTLWDTTKEFIKENPQYIAKPNMMDFISDDNGETYNRCHYWSNFEIGSLDFWRGEAYSKYFDYLDKAGGFFYERWGDAPVHSIGAALFLKPEEVHFFQDIGYRHEPFQHCPQNLPDKCACNPGDSFEEHWYSCTPKWKKVAGFKNGVFQ